MGIGNSGNKGKAGQSRQHHIQKPGVAPLHVGLEVSEAVAYEQDILNSKIALIKAGESLKRYKALRKEELEKRSEIKQTIRNLDVAMKIIKDNLPMLPKSKEIEEKIEPRPKVKLIASKLPPEPKPVQNKEKPSSLEVELLNIKKKLERLQGEQ